MEETIIKVEFFDDGKTCCFGSLAAIFTRFTPEEIGCTLETLWAAKIAPGSPKATSKCLVSKHYIIRKPQSKKKR